jgi:Snf7
MKLQRDKLQQYQRKISLIAARETDIARECLRRGDKKKALVALRRKKYQETLLANTDKQLEQLEILVNDVEFARVQKDVLYGLQQGTTVLKMMQKEMGGVEGVERLLGEAEEARAYTKVRLRMKWRRKAKASDSIGTVGGERNACGTHVESGRGRSGGRVGSIRTPGQRCERDNSYYDCRGASRCANGRITSSEGESERQMGEETEGTAGSFIGGVMEKTNWDEETVIG